MPFAVLHYGNLNILTLTSNVQKISRNIVIFFTILSLIIVIYTFSEEEEAELDGSTGKQDMA